MTVPSTSPDRLYELLPALHRIADAEHGGRCGALLGLINRQADDIQVDLRQLWDDFFIETCQDWVIPYIGDLVGNIPLHDLDVRAAAAPAESLFTDLTGPDTRGREPDPPPGRCRQDDLLPAPQGTPPMLEELARDVTGWGAHVVEFFTLLDWNQHLEHLRLDCHGCPDLRRVDVGDRVGGPWDTRPIPSTSGDQRVGRLVRHPQHRVLPVAPACRSPDDGGPAAHRRFGLAPHVQSTRAGRPAVLGG